MPYFDSLESYVPLAHFKPRSLKRLLDFWMKFEFFKSFLYIILAFKSIKEKITGFVNEPESF